MIQLSTFDEELLAGAHGEAARRAIKVVLEIARIQGAPKLIDISSVHIGGSIYTGQGSLNVVETLVKLGGKVRVPTSINAISIDRQRWREQNIDAEFAGYSERLAAAFEAMGANPVFSCTPYVFSDIPSLGDDIVWAESNAIAFSNSVLGARTNRHGDFLDICAAITGRAPYCGLHLPENRKGTILIEVPEFDREDSDFFSILGYVVGKLAGSAVPVIDGIRSKPTMEQLKAFSATVATSGAVGLYHMVGITPEAPTREAALGGLEPVKSYRLTAKDLADAWDNMSTGQGESIDLVVMGSPHFMMGDFEEFARLSNQKKKHERVKLIITTSRLVYAQAQKQGLIKKAEDFGADIRTDTCLCMLNEHIVHDSHMAMTNSGKFAHYGPGLINRGVYFGSMEDCIESAVQAKPSRRQPPWLQDVS